jgi:hypothetical protein
MQMSREASGQLSRGGQGPGVDSKSPAIGIELCPEAQIALDAEVRSACAAWISQLSVVQRHEANFGARLARCRTPSEASTICGEWMGHRLDSAIAMHHRLLELWLTAATGAAASAMLGTPAPDGLPK